MFAELTDCCECPNLLSAENLLVCNVPKMIRVDKIISQVSLEAPEPMFISEASTVYFQNRCIHKSTLDKRSTTTERGLPSGAQLARVLTLFA